MFNGLYIVAGFGCSAHEMRVQNYYFLLKPPSFCHFFLNSSLSTFRKAVQSLPSAYLSDTAGAVFRHHARSISLLRSVPAALAAAAAA